MNSVQVWRHATKLSVSVDVFTISLKMETEPGIVPQRAVPILTVQNGIRRPCVTTMVNALTRVIQSTPFRHSQHQHCQQSAPMMTTVSVRSRVTPLQVPVFVITHINGTEVNGHVYKVALKMPSVQSTWFAMMATVSTKSLQVAFVRLTMIVNLTWFATHNPDYAFVRTKSSGLGINGAVEQLIHQHL